MPSTKSISSHDAELQFAVREAMSAMRLSQKAAGSKIGCSDAALSQWLSGKYPGDVPELERKITLWMGNRTERNEAASIMRRSPEWIDTESSRSMLSAFSFAHLYGDMAVVYGGAGMGKTMSAFQYKRGHVGVSIATMSPTSNTTVACLERLAAACGVRVTGNRRASWFEQAITERISDTDGLVIIDEAQHLYMSALEVVRSIYDATRTGDEEHPGPGFVLMGNEMVYTKATGGLRAPEFAQLFSRFGIRRHLDKPTTADVSAVADAWGISESRDIAILRDIASRPGAIRGVAKTMRYASRMAAQDGGRLEGKYILAAWRELSGE